MNRPIELKIINLKMDITEALNRSELPPVVARYVIEELLAEVRGVEQMRLEEVRRKFEAAEVAENAEREEAGGELSDQS